MMTKEDIKRIFMEHYDRMYLLARMLLHDDEESRDVVSDVFAVIAEGSVEVLPDTAGSYLLTCVRNKCLKRLRAMQVRQRASQLLRVDDVVEMTPIEAQADRLTQVLDYSEQSLTPQTHRVFQLRYGQRKSYAEIASVLSISETAVYKHLAQALNKIRKHFNP